MYTLKQRVGPMGWAKITRSSWSACLESSRIHCRTRLACLASLTMRLFRPACQYGITCLASPRLALPRLASPALHRLHSAG